MTRVKICGVTSPQEALAAARLGADLLGLNFYEGSPRLVTVEQALAIAEALGRQGPASFETPAFHPSPAAWLAGCARALEALLARQRPLLVGVFVNTAVAEVNAIARACGLDLVQLSGDEDWKYCLSMGRPVIKALRIGQGASGSPRNRRFRGVPTSPQQLLATVPAGAASLLLLDSHVPGLYGGTGTALDWALAREVARQLPVMLAGGLNPDNVAEAVRQVRPWAVDVASGVESGGRKDVAKVGAFIGAAKG